MKMLTKMDEKWRMMTTIFQITFLILLFVDVYIFVVSIFKQQYFASLLSLFLIIFCIFQEKEFKSAKNKNNITEINIIMRCMMGLLGKLY